MAEKAPKLVAEGRVAGILNARELVINIGSDVGVKGGMKFAVLAATPIDVKDPGTDEILDQIDRVKIRVEAHEVRPKITICRTYRKKGGRGFDISAVGSLLGAGYVPSRPETLRADDSDKLPPLSEAESYVKINDRVVEVRD